MHAFVKQCDVSDSEASNDLAMIPAGMQPNHRLVQPKIAIMETRLVELDAVISKLVPAFP